MWGVNIKPKAAINRFWKQVADSAPLEGCIGIPLAV